MKRIEVLGMSKHQVSELIKKCERIKAQLNTTDAGMAALSLKDAIYDLDTALAFIEEALTENRGAS